jgi:hypothetical protein
MSITLAILEEFLVISIFHETKIPTVDMKVQVYSKFRKNKIWKKVKSPISMRNGRFNTSMCRGKLQKMEVLYTHSPKMPGCSSKVPKLKKLKNWKTCIAKGACAVAGGQPLVASWLGPRAPFVIQLPPFSSFLPPFFSSCSQLLLIGSNTCSPYPDFS